MYDRSGFFKDHLINSKGANNCPIKAFAQDARRDRTMRGLRQPEFQYGINDLPAGPNGRTHGEASIDD